MCHAIAAVRVFSDESASTLTVDVPAPGGTFDWHVKGVRR
jgi:hypothetical protein